MRLRLFEVLRRISFSLLAFVLVPAFFFFSIAEKADAYPITSLETPCQTADGVKKPFETKCTPVGYLNDGSGPEGWEWKSFETDERSCGADAPDRTSGGNDTERFKTMDLRPPNLTATDVQCVAKTNVCASAYLCVPNRCTDIDGDGAYLCPANRCLNSSLNPTLSKPLWEQRNTCKTQDCDDNDPEVFPGMTPRGKDMVSASATLDPEYAKSQQEKFGFTPTKSYLTTPIKVTVNTKPCIYGAASFAADISVVIGTETISVGAFTFTKLPNGSNAYTATLSLAGLWPPDLEKVITNIASGSLVTFRITPLPQKPGGYKDFNVLYVLPRIITVGGFGTPAMHRIFPFMETLSPGAIKIPLRLKSVARNTTILREEIDKQLALKNKVLVIGHSLGSAIAYNLRKEYAGRCVEFMYVDPPFNEPICKIPLLNRLSVPTAINKAVCEDIGQIKDPTELINWTNGSGLLHFFSHDPFTFPWYKTLNGTTNRQKLEDLRKDIKVRLGSFSNDCSFRSLPPPTPLKPAPKITGILSSGVLSTSVRPGASITLTGSGFSPTGNFVDIENTANPDIYYELFDLPSDGNTLTFFLPLSPAPPAETTPGTYSLKVSAVDSDWSNALSMIITGNGASEPVSIADIFLSDTGVNTFAAIGSGFTSTGNKVKLTSVGSPSSQYEITGLTSIGKILTFTVPANVPTGTYSVSVATLNGGWVNASMKIYITPTTAEKARLKVLSPGSRDTFNAGALLTVRWTSDQLPSTVPIRLSLWQGRATTTVSNNKLIQGITTPNDGNETSIIPPNARPGLYFFELACADSVPSCAPTKSFTFHVVGSEGSSFMSVDLKVNGSDKPAPIKRKDTITLSWKRSYVNGNCYANWTMRSPTIISDGTFETVFDSRNTRVYQIVCYSNDLRFRTNDSVAVTPI